MRLGFHFFPLTAAAAVLAWAACSTPAGRTSDGGALPSDDGGVTEPRPPEAPQAPALTPCPAGWREVAGADPDVPQCDAWPEGGPGACAPDEAHFPGEPGCSRLGTACPTSEWPAGLPTDQPVLYVRAGAGAGGAGTPAAPFGTIAAAMAQASAGTVIALGRGTFDEAVRLRGGVTLWGACVAGTLVTSSAASTTAGTITITGAGAVVQNLRVSGARPGILVAAAPAAVHLEDVLVESAQRFGLALGGGQLTAHTLAVRGTRASTGDGQGGRGMEIAAGDVSIDRGTFDANVEAGIIADSSAATLTLTNAAVCDTQGRGLNLQHGARVTVARTVLERNQQLGVSAIDLAAVELRDVVVRDTRMGLDGRPAKAMTVTLGGQLTLNRALVERTQGLGIGSFDEGTRLTATDVVVRDTEGDPSGEFGRGLEVAPGAQASVTRALFERNQEVGVIASGPSAATLSLADVVIRETRSVLSDGTSGRGLQAQLGAQVEVTRVRLERNREGGAAACTAGTRLRLSDVVVIDTLERACALGSCAGFGAGIGLIATDAAAIEVSRFVISRSALSGLLLATGGTIDLHQGEVSQQPIGANVQTDGFDVQRLMDEVIFRDNQRNLDASALPVPQFDPPPAT